MRATQIAPAGTADYLLAHQNPRRRRDQGCPLFPASAWRRRRPSCLATRRSGPSGAGTRRHLLRLDGPRCAGAGAVRSAAVGASALVAAIADRNAGTDWLQRSRSTARQMNARWTIVYQHGVLQSRPRHVPPHLNDNGVEFEARQPRRTGAARDPGAGDRGAFCPDAKVVRVQATGLPQRVPFALAAAIH